MKIFFRVIYWLIWIFLCFIIVNLVIWSVKYGWVSDYARILNGKDWQSSVSNISFSPKSWISIFYQDEDVKDDIVEHIIQESTDTDANVDMNIDTNTTATKEVNHNPYDPDYEDEFNSFFGVKNEDEWQKVQGQTQEEIYDDLQAPWFKLDE